MEIKTYDQLRQNMKHQTKRTVVVASAIEGKTLEAVLKAADDGMVDYILTGSAKEIQDVAASIGRKVSTDLIYDTKDENEAAAKAVELINTGDADFIQKGMLHTAAFLKPIVNRDTGLRIGKMMNYVSMFETPKYHKLFCLTDGGMQIDPDLKKKKEMIESTVDLFHSFGVETPNVACLCAVEDVNPKMQETVDAAALKEMNQKGEITGCVVEGPISFDLAMNPATAKVKHFASPVAGNTDILLMPSIASGNALLKAMYLFGDAVMGGVVVGGKCPISLTSRDSTIEGRIAALVLSLGVLNA